MEDLILVDWIHWYDHGIVENRHQYLEIHANIFTGKISLIKHMYYSINQRGEIWPSTKEIYYLDKNNKNLFHLQKFICNTLDDLNIKCDSDTLRDLYILLAAIEMVLYRFPPTYHKLYLLAKKDKNNILGKLPLEIWHHVLMYLDKDHLLD